MTFADTLWRNAITARSTMITAANYSAAFYGNAAVQGLHLGMTAPLTFWQTLLDAPRGGKPDDLTALRGIGAKLAASLNEIGIYHVDQIAALDAEGIDWLDENIPGFKLACTRFDIVAGAANRA